ncbi:MAG: LPXTG cell wall anchor domain-containing protein [Gudongella sp.]|nr:LPXTG cell wall anchor domain-containing protein [Gudongella sp.]
MFIFFAIFGLIVLITGIILKMKSKKKVWNILIGLGIMGVIISLILFICTILLVYGQDDNIPSSSIDSIDIDIYVCDYMPW